MLAANWKKWWKRQESANSGKCPGAQAKWAPTGKIIRMDGGEGLEKWPGMQNGPDPDGMNKNGDGPARPEMPARPGPVPSRTPPNAYYPGRTRNEAKQPRRPGARRPANGKIANKMELIKFKCPGGRAIRGPELAK